MFCEVGSRHGTVSLMLFGIVPAGKPYVIIHVNIHREAVSWNEIDELGWCELKAGGFPVMDAILFIGFSDHSVVGAVIVGRPFHTKVVRI